MHLLSGIAWAAACIQDVPEADAPPWLPDVDAGLHEELSWLSDEVRVSGILALDGLIYDDRSNRPSGLDLSRATLRVDGRAGSAWTWRVAPDLVGRDTRYGLEEAWARWQPAGRTQRVTAGLIKVAGGTEYAQPREDLSFVGYGFNAYLDGLTDWGVMAEGEHGEGLFSWEVSATVGAGFNPIGQDRDEPQLAGRVVTYPFRDSVFEGLFAGASYSWTDGFEGQLDIVGPLRAKYFDTPELEADESSWFHLSSGWDLGSVRLLHEVERGSLEGLELPGGGEADLEDQITAWQASIAWMVTGETYDSRPFRAADGRPGRVPRDPAFGPEATGVGAWEVAARYANGDIDRDFFDLGITDYQTSSQEFRTFSFAVSWFPTSDLRATAQVVRTLADDDVSALGDGGRDTSFVLRLQWSF